MKMIAKVLIVVDTIHELPIAALDDVEKAVHFLLANKDGVTYIISSIEQEA